jgi:hypothetical protein
MSCPVPPPLLKLYSNKLNIYDNPNFIPLPPWRSCPAPSMIFIAPAIVTPSSEGCPPSIYPIPQPVNPVGSYYVYPNSGSGVGGTSAPPYASCQSCK